MKKNIGKINKYLFICIMLLYLHNNKLYCMGNISNKDKKQKDKLIKMGCHTWYKIPLVKGKENIQQYVREKIDADKKQEWWNDKCEEEAILTINAINDLDENMDENSAILLGAYYDIEFINKEPIIYIDAYAYDIDEPRVGGHPDTIIKSADEMFKAMENGVVNSDGDICNFYWDKDRDSYIRNNIIGFFNSHPDGIIDFG